jgi:DNA replication and repair protein RecF
MNVTSVRLEGFRNYASFSRDFSDGVNVIAGRNAQGKTNLIEAVYYLAAGRSFRARSDAELIGFGREDASVKLTVMDDEYYYSPDDDSPPQKRSSPPREKKLEVRLHRGKRRELYHNGVKERNFAQMAGQLTAVLFCPEDLELVRGGAAARRRLMDLCLAQLRPSYSAALSEYTKLHDHKTRILRDYREKPSLLDALEEFNVGLARAGAELICLRAAFARSLQTRASRIHRDFSDGAEELTVRYKTVTGVEELLPPVGKPSGVAAALLERMRELREAELSAGACLTGPHKDDLEIAINGLSARQYASQGQSRTAAVSLKLAERDIVTADTGRLPVLLLDDVLSELDAARQAFLLERISVGQVLITCCEHVQLTIDNGQLTIIDGGTVIN